MSRFHGAILATAALFSMPAMAAEDCVPGILAEVDIITDDQTGAWAVPVFFGDVQKYFLINTTSAFSTINESVVAELGLNTFNSSVEMVDAAGQRFNPALARPDLFRIGQLQAQDLAF